MIITKQMLINKIRQYLNRSVSLQELVDWSEEAMMEADFDDKDMPVIRHVIGRLGLADVKEFGLSWEDCEELISQLGYHAQVELIED